MAHEKFVGRSYTEEERTRWLHKDKELTEAEKEKVKRYKEMIEEMRRRAREAELEQRSNVIDDEVSDKIDHLQESRDER